MNRYNGRFLKVDLSSQKTEDMDFLAPESPPALANKRNFISRKCSRRNFGSSSKFVDEFGRVAHPFVSPRANGWVHRFPDVHLIPPP
jgi:hypothetical protein